MVILIPISYGQSLIPEGQTTKLKMTVKKYEVVETEIRTIDHQLVYANTDLVFIGKKTRDIDLERFKNKPDTNPSSPANQFLQVNRPNSGSVLFVINNNKKTNLKLAFDVEPKSFEGKHFYVGYPSNKPANSYFNLTTLALAENRSITDLPGYIPAVGYGLKLK